jgi:hypothetical protein
MNLEMCKAPNLILCSYLGLAKFKNLDTNPLRVASGLGSKYSYKLHHSIVRSVPMQDGYLTENVPTISFGRPHMDQVKYPQDHNPSKDRQ